MKIYAPVKSTNGIYASVRFVNGVGETDDQNLIEWFRSHGFEVEETIEKRVKTTENPVEKCVENDLDSMTPLELREYAKAIGLGGEIKNTRNKEKLLEVIRG